MKYIETKEGRMAIMPEAIYQELMTAMQIGARELLEISNKTTYQHNACTGLYHAVSKCRGYRNKQQSKKATV